MILFGIIFAMLITLIVVCCYVIAIAFTVWMMVDAGKQDRFWWLAIIIALPLVGAALYYFTEKKHEYVRVPLRALHFSETEAQHEKSPKKKRRTNLRQGRESADSKQERKEEVKEESVEEVKEENQTAGE